MSNPNNLIRPPVLQGTTAGAQEGPSTSEAAHRVGLGANQDQLTAAVMGVVQNIFQTHGKRLVQNALNPNSNFADFSDQGIDPVYRNNLSDLDKIPDVVRF